MNQGKDNKIVVMGMVVGAISLLVITAILFYLISPLDIEFTLAERIVLGLKLLVLPAGTLLVGVLVVGMTRFGNESQNPLKAEFKSERMRINCRYLSNTVEQLILFCINLLALAVLLPLTELHWIIIYSILFVLGRVIFWISYQINVLYRAPGFAITFMPTVIAIIVNISLLFSMSGGFVTREGNSELTAKDYHELTQLINRYAYGIDTCGNNGYDYANVFTVDGMFIDKNSDTGFASGGNVLAQGRDALAELVGGGSRGCATKLVWTDWSHLMLNHEITPSAEGATGRIYLVQMGMRGPESIDRHGGYEDVYVRTDEGWRIKTRTHVRNKAWHAEALQTPDMN